MVVRSGYLGEELLDGIVGDAASEYIAGDQSSDQFYINPFNDWAFKKIFTSETSKEVVKAFLNEVLAGKRQIERISYGKNEYPGEIADEGGAVFDFICTDIDGAVFFVEVQRQKQKYFKERSLFYASRLISDHAPKGKKKWKYNLQDIYAICLLEKFCLPDTESDEYLHYVSLCHTKTGKPFYDKLHFIYIEVTKFSKTETELQSPLDQWIYALKHASTIKQEPQFLIAQGLTDFFYLARYANLTKEERNMYRTAQQRAWDNYSIIEYAKEEGLEEGLEKGAMIRDAEIALKMKRDGVDVERIARYTNLSKEQIEEL